MARVFLFLAEVFFVMILGYVSEFPPRGQPFAVQAVLGDKHQLYLPYGLLRKRYALAGGFLYFAVRQLRTPCAVGSVYYITYKAMCVKCLLSAATNAIFL